MPMSESVAQSLAEPIGGTGLDARTVTVAALAAALESRALTATALAAFYLDRIQRLNPALRAVISTSPQALDEAAASDARRERRQSRGLLDGIPVLVKDNLAVTGRPATAGSPPPGRGGAAPRRCPAGG